MAVDSGVVRAHQHPAGARHEPSADVPAEVVATAELNRILKELREARQPPSKAGKRLNLLYATQVTTRPPRFRISVNDPTLVTRDYGYWVENQLRERLALDGVPVNIDFVRRA